MAVTKPTVGSSGWGTVLNTALDALDTEKAPKASPTFTGTVVLPSTTSIGTISAAELAYVDGVTSSIQTQLDTKLATATAASTYLTTATAASTYLTTATAASTYLPTATASSTYATIANNNLKSNTADPTFTGTVTKPISSITSYQKFAVAAVTTPITTTTYTVPVTDTFVIFNSSAAVAVTLPAAASFTGRTLHFKTISTGAVTSASANVVALATGTAASTIFSANTAGKWTILVSNGTNWVIMSQN